MTTNSSKISGSSMILIDSRVTGYQTLIDNLTTPGEIFIIDAESDGVVQIAAKLHGRSDIDSLHIISHGSSGALYLGSTVLDSGNLSMYAPQLASIGSALTESGDVLLYGCYVAQSEVGQQFIQSLSMATGADVAASSNATGVSILGGDTLLEQVSGIVETAGLALNSLTELLAANNPPSVGIATTSLGPNFGRATSMELQADGKILVAGYLSYLQTNFVLVRYNNNGSLDTSFSGDGIVTTSIGTGHDVANGMALQADGKILLTGYSTNSITRVGDIALVRYNSDGSLDSSFSGDGIVTNSFGSNSSLAASIALQADGKIFVAGSIVNGAKTDFVLVRYNNNGSLDTSFSGDGIVTNSFGSNSGAASIALQADGKILVAGNINYNNGKTDIALVRYNSDGSLDSSFSGDGIVTNSLGSNSSSAASIALQADGKIFVAGSIVNGDKRDFVLVRYNNNGSLDTSFSGDGIVTNSYGSNSSSAASIALQADGKILLGGSSINLSSGVTDFAMVRYNSNGSLDSSFSGDGIVATQFGSYMDFAKSMRLQADGKILAPATSVLRPPNATPADNSDVFFGLIRYNSDGSLDSSFVGNANPTGAVNISGAAKQGQVLTAANTLADLDGIPTSGTGTVAYQWLADGVNINNATSTSFTLTQAQVGKAISVKASYTDQQGTAESVTSTATSAVANVNDLPTGGVTIAGTASQGQALIASNTLADIDGIPTAGLGAIKYQWKAGDVAISGATSSTYTLTQAEVGKAITVTASYTDLHGTAEIKTSTATAAVANVNDLPAGGITITGTATQGQTLTVINKLVDLDGIPSSGGGAISYQWRVGEVNIARAASSNYTLTQAEVGKSISVTASYTDLQGTAEFVISNSTSPVANLDDVATANLSVTGTAAVVGSKLVARLTSVADLDGPITAVSYAWQENIGTTDFPSWVLLTVGSSLNILDASFAGRIVRVSATTTDILGGKTEFLSSPQTLLNNNPAVGFVTISGSATQGQTLSASNTLSDVDGIPASGIGAISYQ
jgi:uncharacterized delta-60 repeat protein